MSIHCNIKQFTPAKSVPVAVLDTFFERIVWGAENLIESIVACRHHLNKRGKYPEWCDGSQKYISRLCKIGDDLEKVETELFKIEGEFAPTRNKHEKLMRDLIVMKKRLKTWEATCNETN